MVRVLTTFCTRCKPSIIASLVTLSLTGIWHRCITTNRLYRIKSRYRSGCEYIKQLFFVKYTPSSYGNGRTGGSREDYEPPPSSSLATASHHRFSQPIDKLLDVIVVAATVRGRKRSAATAGPSTSAIHQPAGVQDRAVIATAERFPDVASDRLVNVGSGAWRLGGETPRFAGDDGWSCPRTEYRSVRRPSSGWIRW